MSTSLTQAIQTAIPLPHAALARRRYHRLHEARRASGLSLAVVAARLGLSVENARRQESAGFDLPVSALRRWAEALGAPLEELVIEPKDGLAPPPFTRKRLERMVRIAATIAKTAQRPDARRLAERLIAEVAPFLRGFGERTL
jgi:transcriptional regulator with XRE-family HTH domain